MKIARSLAVAAAAGAMALGVVGTTAASAGTGPAGAQSPGGEAPAAASHGPTYLNEHGPGGNSYVVYAPSRFRLLNTNTASIYTSPTYWPRWYQNSAVGAGHMYGVRYHQFGTDVGNVTMVFSHRLSNGYFVNTGRTFSYFENVRISGIRPGNGGSVQYWHWSWNKDNWVNNR